LSDFAPTVTHESPARLAEALSLASEAQVARMLDRFDERGFLSLADAPVLFSRAARPALEALAQRASTLTRARFGRTMALYAPLYLSSACVNRCTYCGFSAERKIDRQRLSLAEALEQADILLDQGVRQLLLVSGEAPAVYGLDDLRQVARALRPKLASLSIEVFPCDLAGYQALVGDGVDALVIYQETYDRTAYARLHPGGPKSDFDKRLAAVEAGGQAGFRSLGIGALFGLTPADVEACLVAAHGDFLTRRYPGARLAVSFPRLRPVPGGTQVLSLVDDTFLVQAIVGMRLLFPDAELVVSTRESAVLRDRLLGLGVTRLSAGSRTTPGGYRSQMSDSQSGQFETDDTRSVAEVSAAVRKAGYDVVTKDFDPAFVVEEGMAR
jgi:2-iminoacetate synthase